MADTLFPTQDLDTILTMLDAAMALGDEELAIQLCEAAAAIAPEDVDVSLTHATLLDDLGRTDDARATLERCAAHHGDVPVVWQRLGELSLDVGDSERAVEAFRQWQRLDGANSDNEFALAWAYFVDLQPAKARDHVASGRSIESSEEAADLAARLAAIDDEGALESEVGSWLCSRGALERGLSLLTSSVSRRDDPVARHRLGVALTMAGRTAEAIGHLRQAIDAEPPHPDWLHDLGTAQLLAGDLDAADSTFERLLETVHPSYDGLIGQGRVALCRNQPERAIELADGVLADHHDSAVAWMLRSSALLTLGRAVEALVSAEHAIAFQADDRVAWSTAAQAADAAGAAAIAARYDGRARVRLSGSLGIAEGNIEVGTEIEDELHELDRLVVADPLIREIYRHRSGIALELGLPARSLAYLRAAIERGVIAESTASICDEGVLLLMSGDLDRAEAEFRAVLADDPGFQAAHEGLTEITRRRADSEPVVPEVGPWTPTHHSPPNGTPAFHHPGGKEPPVADLQPGLAVEVLEQSANWAHVRCENGWECWVDLTLLVPIRDSWKPTHTIPSAGMASRTAPYSASDDAGEVVGGLHVDVIARAGSWAHVRFENGWTCWVAGDPLEPLS